MFAALFMVFVLTYCIKIKIYCLIGSYLFFAGANGTGKCQIMAQGCDLSAGRVGCAALVRRRFLVEEILRIFN